MGEPRSFDEVPVARLADDDHPTTTTRWTITALATPVSSVAVGASNVTRRNPAAVIAVWSRSRIWRIRGECGVVAHAGEEGAEQADVLLADLLGQPLTIASSQQAMTFGPRRRLPSGRVDEGGAG
ncbi:hypothetical protein GCM10023215_25010 [Pseudonocardia yuanmonensis]|uniref:Uncharacterized protein n=1 Tax=Pseudonocardia yuanmonensis TaxID=1095914 RepID=A0ABP8WEI9_9PSEU